MEIMCRQAEDDFKALLTAQGMENAGANVFSITPNGSSTYQNAIDPHTRFIVWAKVESKEIIAKVDIAIEKELYG